VLKAMANKPEDRYGSARALADDVEHWLADKRVEAYPEPWTRTLTRWLTRHRTPVTGAAAALLVGLAGLGGRPAPEGQGRGRPGPQERRADPGQWQAHRVQRRPRPPEDARRGPGAAGDRGGEAVPRRRDRQPPAQGRARAEGSPQDAAQGAAGLLPLAPRAAP